MTGWDAILAAARAEREVFRAAAPSRDPGNARCCGESSRRMPRANSAGRIGSTKFASVEAFRAHVPVRSYEELGAWLARLSAGAPGILTQESVVALRGTGGRSAKS